MGLLCGARELSFITEHIKEVLEEPLDPGTPLGLLAQRELHAGNREKGLNNCILLFIYIYQILN